MNTATIITPAYNRAHTLPQCYYSLKEQTSNDFVWLIVDGGSVDETEKLVGEWKSNTNKFSIQYVKKDNGGKASALNVAFDMVKTPYVCVLDSDDYLVEYCNENGINYSPSTKVK